MYVCGVFVVQMFPRTCDMPIKCPHLTEHQEQLELLVICHEDRQRQVGECTVRHSINGFSLLRQWSCSCPATCQRVCVNQKSETMDGLTVPLFCDVHIDIHVGATLNLLKSPFVICRCRVVQTNNVERSLSCTAGYMYRDLVTI